MISFIHTYINDWVNDEAGEAGDLRRHRAYYDVIVMFKQEDLFSNGPTTTYSI